MTQTSEMEFEEMEMKNMQKEDSLLIATINIAIDPTIPNREYLTRKFNELMKDALQFFWIKKRRILLRQYSIS